MTTELEKYKSQLAFKKNYKYTDAYNIKDNIIRLNNILVINSTIQNDIKKIMKNLIYIIIKV